MMTSDRSGRPTIINNFWKALANHPASLKRVWSTGKEVMAPVDMKPTKEGISLGECESDNTALEQTRGRPLTRGT